MSTTLKRLLSAILLVAVVFAIAAFAKINESKNEETKDLLEEIKDRGYLIIATEGNWSPWTYHDESDELVGLDIEIGKAIAEYIGVEAKFEETDWDSILAGVDAGRFDIACNGVGYTEARAEKYNFSTPYVYTHKVLVVRADETEINSLEDLKGKTTANTASSTYAALAEKYGATVTPANTLLDTIQLLEQGRVDATINAEGSIKDYLDQHPEAQLRMIPIAAGDPVAYPMPKTEEAESLLKAVNEALEEMRQNGKLAEISIKYFGVDMTKESE